MKGEREGGDFNRKKSLRQLTLASDSSGIQGLSPEQAAEGCPGLPSTLDRPRALVLLELCSGQEGHTPRKLPAPTTH